MRPLFLGADLLLSRQPPKNWPPVRMTIHPKKRQSEVRSCSLWISAQPSNCSRDTGITPPIDFFADKPAITGANKRIGADRVSEIFN